MLTKYNTPIDFPKEVGNLFRVGVLAVQGSVREHLDCLSKIDNVIPTAVKTKNEILSVDALILPGGESTAIGKILKEFALSDAIKDLNAKRAPIWGTCAGMVLMAKEIEGESSTHLALMDIKVRRNAFGGQLDSFVAQVKVPSVSEKLQDLVFIRAPFVVNAGTEVQVLAKIRGFIVAARQNNLFVTSFHPELTNETVFYEYFVNMIENYRLKSSLSKPPITVN